MVTNHAEFEPSAHLLVAGFNNTPALATPRPPSLPSESSDEPLVAPTRRRQQQTFDQLGGALGLAGLDSLHAIDCLMASQRDGIRDGRSFAGIIQGVKGIKGVKVLDGWMDLECPDLLVEWSWITCIYR